jgi:hypothetical protein
MCTFNTLLLPASAQLDAVNVIAHATLGHRFMPQGHAAIEDAAAPDARSFIKNNGCDCGMGLAERATNASHAPSDRELRKRRAEGWSEAKIERWLAQRKVTRERHEQEHHRRGEAHRDQARRWTAFVRRILDEGVAAWVGLFTHEYQGSVHSERISIAGVRKFVGVTDEQVSLLEEDIPFVFATR